MNRKKEQRGLEQVTGVSERLLPNCGHSFQVELQRDFSVQISANKSLHGHGA